MSENVGHDPCFHCWSFCPCFHWPNFRALLQIWGNCKFQIWGNAPNLGQKPILNLEFEWENLLSASHNYSWTCPEPSSLFLCALLATTIKRYGNITKTHVLDNKNFSEYGKLTQIWRNFFDGDTLTQIWGNSEKKTPFTH